MAGVDNKFNLRDWEWIAVHFPLSEREYMAKVAWLICCKCTPEEISERKIDPRIVIPLCTIVLLDEKDFLQLKQFEQEANYYKFEQEDGYYHKIFLRFKEKRESISRIKQGFINPVIDSINPSEKWQSLFETLDIDLQFSLLYHLINYRLPTRDDWRNIFLDVKYKFLPELCFPLALILIISSSLLFLPLGLILGLINMFFFSALEKNTLLSIFVLNWSLFLFYLLLEFSFSLEIPLLILVIMSFIFSISWIYAQNIQRRADNPLKDILKYDSSINT